MTIDDAEGWGVEEPLSEEEKELLITKYFSYYEPPDTPTDSSVKGAEGNSGGFARLCSKTYDPPGS